MRIRIECDLDAIGGTKVWIDDEELTQHTHSIEFSHIAGDYAKFRLVRFKTDEAGYHYLDPVTGIVARDIIEK